MCGYVSGWEAPPPPIPGKIFIWGDLKVHFSISNGKVYNWKKQFSLMHFKEFYPWRWDVY